jgi:lipoprotein-anchoring transpeptidase ErfK/SrfK
MTALEFPRDGMAPFENNSRRHRVALIATICVVGGLLLLAVGAWAYDNAQKDKIANGVTIGGVDVGGMDVGDARKVVRHRVVAPLRKPVTVSYAGEIYRLTPERLRQKADVQGMLDEAVAESRDGGIVGRVARYVEGGDVDVDVPAVLSYSHKEVKEFVDELAERINRDPVDATVIPSGDTLSPQPGEKGVSMRKDKVQNLIEGELGDPIGGRTVSVVVRKTDPEVTRAELADAYPTYVTIDRGAYTLRLFKNLKLAKSYTIAVGQAGLETPAGLYTVQDKQVNPYWYVPNSSWAGDLAGTVVPPGPSNPLQARWIGIADGAGIHGTTDIGSLGSSASHGCVRMSVPDVIDLYDRVPMGTPIYVQ